MGTERLRTPCGAWRVLEHCIRITGELRVVRTDGGVDTSGVEQSAEDRVMKTGAPRRRDRGIDDLPSELVSEREGVAVVDEEARVHARLDALLTLAQSLAQHRDRSSIGEKRGRVEHFAGLGVESTRPCEHRFVHRRQCAGLGSEELVDDERHSRTETVELAGVPPRLRSEVTDCTLTERSESEPPQRGSSREIAEHAAQRMVASDLVPVRHDQQAPREIQPATCERDEVERRRVCPLEIVDDGDDGRVGVGPRCDEL